MQAGTTEQWLDRDPAATRAQRDAVRGTGRETLSEMRRPLGVLREDEPTLIAQPGLDQLDDTRPLGPSVSSRAPVGDHAGMIGFGLRQ